MCGIAGIINFNQNKVEETSLRRMMQCIKHRGPDDDGVFTEENIGFGFVRLSIIDLSVAGHQPKHSADDRYVIVFNGEIFNYIEIRKELEANGVVFNTKTDTEVLLNAYIYWGEECLHKLNGMWAFAIYDKQDKSVFAARDRYGVKPFYYLLTKESFAFCSEINPLLSLTNKQPATDTQSIFDFLVFNRTDQTENTFFKEIKKLQHGSKLFIKNGKVTFTKWYDLKKEVSKTKGFDSPEEYKQLLKSAIELRLRSDVPIGVCLSGGLDSSSIVSILLKELNVSGLNTFSAVYNKGQYGDETEFINEFTPHVKNMHYISPNAISLEKDLLDFVKAHGEPIPTTGPYAQFKVMELAKGKAVVTLDGQGADEELAGYHYFFGFYYKDLLKQFKLITLIKEMFFYLSIHKSLYGIKTFFYFLLPEKLKTKFRVNEYNYMNEAFAKAHQAENSIAGNIYGSGSLKDALLDHFEYKLEHLLKWEDRNSMYFSLEARVPFLDYRLVEKTLATSSNKIIKDGVTKYILREAMKGILPEKIRMRRDKMGYGTPEDEWFREPAWQKIVKEIINSDSFKQRNLVDVKKANELYQKHVSGSVNISKEIWKWVHLELWFREFIDKK